jgi:hypothetical protein
MGGRLVQLAVRHPQNPTSSEKFLYEKGRVLHRRGLDQLETEMMAFSREWDRRSTEKLQTVCGGGAPGSAENFSRRRSRTPGRLRRSTWLEASK